MGTERAIISSSLDDPQPWDTLCLKERFCYRLMDDQYELIQYEEKKKEELDHDCIDIEKLVQTVQEQLTRRRLSIKELADKLEMGSSTLRNLINYPEPWESLTEALKLYYRNLNTWCV
jgi:DNA-binding transcriptional regulator YiaG